MPFTIEFNIKTQNTIGVYIYKQGSNYYYQISFGYSGSNYVKLCYSDGIVEFYLNNKLERTTEVDFEDNPVGFSLVDWQNDIDCEITNFRIYQNQ